jgi:type I restriction-modification system DNA methylase subunit
MMKFITILNLQMMSVKQLDNIIEHIRNRSYMSGIDRDKLRVKSTGEVFTPTDLVQEVLDEMKQEQFTDTTKTFLDPSCGDGQFLGEVLIRKMENGSTFEQALGTIYGVDLMSDNVELCRERLLCGRNDLRHIVEQNIVCADGLRYHYRFDGSHPYDDEQKEQIFQNLFEFG